MVTTEKVIIMTVNGNIPVGSVRKLTPEELQYYREKIKNCKPIEPDEGGTYRIPIRFVIRPEDWRGFTGTTIKRVDSDE